MRLRHAGRGFARLDRTTAHGTENSRKIGGSFRQAEEFSKFGGGGAVLSPLGDLLVGYINFAFGGETKTPVVANLAAQIEKTRTTLCFRLKTAYANCRSTTTT